MAKHRFKTEVSQLLDLIIHSLYSHQEIFLRELVSNASDALDKLRYLTLTDADFKGAPFTPRIDISFDSEANPKTLTVSDSGIGMSADELRDNLGTIARSGTKRFLDAMRKEAKEAKEGAPGDSNLIGQFGVGFYSSFMAADRVEVLSLRAGDDQAHRWTSNGRGSYEITPAERTGAGTTVTLQLNESGAEFASRWQIDSLVKKYSNHIPYPIHLHYTETNGDKTEPRSEQINAASALWKRPKSELSDSDYFEFYRSLTHDDEEPLHYVHTHAEGTQEYTTLFYVPQKAPPDLYYADYRPGVKLYVKRVFITDDDKELLPTWLRFVRGVIDSEDLPLNVSRELLQRNRVLTGIRNASVKKLLSEFRGLTNNPERYRKFVAEFGRPLKEGLYQDFANREALLELVRFRTTAHDDDLTGLKDYVGRMQPEQKAIYYLTGERGANLRNSPLLEVYREQNLEVLLMDDEIDAFVIPAIGKYQEHELKSVNRSDTADDLKTDRSQERARKVEPLLKRIKQVLGDEVKEVKASARLSDSPSCIVADESDPTVSMQSVLRALGQEAEQFKPVLEINPDHAIVTKLEALLEAGPEEVLEDTSRLLLEQALLIEGAQLADPVAFAGRLNRSLDRALA